MRNLNAYSVLVIVLVSLLAFKLIIKTPTGVSEEETDIATQIENAKTADDHIKIAGYYDAEAAKMESGANRHDSMAKAYEHRSKPMKSMVNHCENISKKLRESAEQYKAMSMEHRKMAQEMNN